MDQNCDILCYNCSRKRIRRQDIECNFRCCQFRNWPVFGHYAITRSVWGFILIHICKQVILDNAILQICSLLIPQLSNEMQWNIHKMWPEQTWGVVTVWWYLTLLFQCPQRPKRESMPTLPLILWTIGKGIQKLCNIKLFRIYMYPS